MTETLNTILTGLLTAVLPILAGLLIDWLRLQRKRFLVDLTDRQSLMIDEVVESAINVAEEAARVALKSNQPGLTGADKLKLAVDFASSEFSRKKLPEAGSNVIASLIQSRIGSLRKDATSPVVDN